MKYLLIFLCLLSGQVSAKKNGPRLFNSGYDIAQSRCDKEAHLERVAIPVHISQGGVTEFTPSIEIKNGDRNFVMHVKTEHYQCAYRSGENLEYAFTPIVPLKTKTMRLMNSSAHIKLDQEPQQLVSPESFFVESKLETALERVLTNAEMHRLLKDPSAVIIRELVVEIDKPTNQYTSFSKLHFYGFTVKVWFYHLDGEIAARLYY